jgi:hypothetical protein
MEGGCILEATPPDHVDMRPELNVVLPVRAIHDRAISGNIAPIPPPDLIIVLISQAEVMRDNYTSNNTGIPGHTPRDRTKLRPKDAVERAHRILFEVSQLVQRFQDIRPHVIRRRMERYMTRICAIY